MSEEQALTVQTPDVLTTAFAPTSGGQVEYIAGLLATSKCIPEAFQNNLGDCMIALDFALRLQISPLAVMQEMYTVHGRPSFSAKFMNAVVYRSREFSRIKYNMGGDGTSRWCQAYMTEISTGEVIEGTTITWRMVDEEGWAKKRGSKWLTMAEQMFKYRAAAFLVRSTCPDLVLGMVTHDEAEDIAYAQRVINVPNEPARDAGAAREAYESAAAEILEGMKHESCDNVGVLATMYADLQKIWHEHMGDAAFDDDVAHRYMTRAGLATGREQP